MTTKKKTTKKKAEPQNQKDKKWYQAHLKRRAKQRRQSYAKDPDYRAKLIEQARAAYREKNPVEHKDCRANLTRLSEIGTIRVVRLSSGVKKRLTFNMAETAEALDSALISIYRWINDGRLIRPVVKPIYEGGGQFMTEAVYTEPEMKAIIKVLGNHQATVTQYRVSHKETKSAINAAVKNIRKTTI